MRRAGTTLLLTTMAVAALAAAGAAPASAVTVNCGVKRMTMLFWPRGHGSKHLAYMSFYKLTRSFRRGDLLGVIDRDGGGTFIPACRHTSSAPLRAVSRPLRTRRSSELRCGFTVPATINVHPISQEDDELGIDVLVGRRVVLDAKLFEDKPSTLTYDKTYCHRSAPPH
jgi:hypothetical protein